MAEYRLRCIMCGTASEVQDSDVGQLQAAKDKQVYICPSCQAKIKHESEQKYK